MTPRDAFVVVAAAWFFASFLGALPLYFSGWVPSFTDAFFESVSGFTTTGATNLPDVEILPKALNMWRCQMHWLGGMGIVALTVALMPLLGVGGFKLIKAETELWKEPADPVLEAVAKVVSEEKSLWCGTASELLQLLPDLDVQPNVLTRKLNIGAEQLFVNYGVRYESNRKCTGRIIKLELLQS